MERIWLTLGATGVSWFSRTKSTDKTRTLRFQTEQKWKSAPSLWWQQTKISHLTGKRPSAKLVKLADPFLHTMRSYECIRVLDATHETREGREREKEKVKYLSPQGIMIHHNRTMNITKDLPSPILDVLQRCMITKRKEINPPQTAIWLTSIATSTRSFGELFFFSLSFWSVIN